MTLADFIRRIAAALKERAANPYQERGGMSDRVQMRVVGPDGEIKAETDTK